MLVLCGSCPAPFEAGIGLGGLLLGVMNWTICLLENLPQFAFVDPPSHAIIGAAIGAVLRTG